MARNGTPLRTAASQLQLDIAVLTSLGELGIEADIEDASQSSDGLPEPTDIELETTIEELI